MTETSEVNDYELLKIEKMKRYNVCMVELGLQHVRYLGKQILSSQKESTKCRPTKKYSFCACLTILYNTLTVHSPGIEPGT